MKVHGNIQKKYSTFRHHKKT